MVIDARNRAGAITVGISDVELLFKPVNREEEK